MSLLKLYHLFLLTTTAPYSILVLLKQIEGINEMTIKEKLKKSKEFYTLVHQKIDSLMDIHDLAGAELNGELLEFMHMCLEDVETQILTEKLRLDGLTT